jgi:hypothetical protein
MKRNHGIGLLTALFDLPTERVILISRHTRRAHGWAFNIIGTGYF